MTKQVSEKGAGLPANVTSMAAALAQSAGDAGSTGAGELYLKMDKFGEWQFGPEGVIPEDDAILAINPMGFQHGWTAWGSKERGNNGTNVGERMVAATQPMPAEMDLPEVNGDWSKQISVQMRITNGEDEGLQLLWKANSLGARKAYAAILQEVVGRIGEGSADIVPLVSLNAESYTHKTYGKIFTPLVEIVGWANMEGEQAAEPVEALEEQEEETPEPVAKVEEKEKPTRRRRRKAS